MLNKIWSSIGRPDRIGAEDTYCHTRWKIKFNELVKKYDWLSQKGLFWEKSVYLIVLLPDKNLFVILGGSAASLPINILTGKIDNICLFSLQLLASLAFF